MKILFVCSCLEPGMDGVGDYTRRLAAEIAARGHSCHLLALADHHVQQATELVFREAPFPIPALRLPSTVPWKKRIEQAIQFREAVGPDWFSWQIVLYGYDPRGLSFGLGTRFRQISGTCRNEIMFHEIWIGEAEGSPLKSRVIGKIQRHIIKDLLLKIRPPVVHTHTPLYQHLLGQLGWKATLLPLFGNIPLSPRPDSDWLANKWPELGTLFQATSRNAWWIFVIFGSIHPEWDSEEFWQKASESAQRAGKKCALISIGRPGTAGEQTLRSLQKQESDSWKLLFLGQQSEEDVSQCLFAADFGVSAVPPEYMGKSGTAAAMIEHGLPIIATRPAYRYRNVPVECTRGAVPNVVSHLALEDLTKTAAGSLLPGVASQFCDDLQQV